MKIIPKPLVVVHRPAMSAMHALVVMNPSVPKTVAYQHLVTEHNVDPDRAQQLLTPPRK